MLDQPGGTPVPANASYYFAVTDMTFYAMEVRQKNFLGDRFLLDLNEISCQQYGIENAHLTDTTFTVNKATNALTVAFVDRRGDRDTRVSRTSFNAYPDTTSFNNPAVVKDPLNLTEHRQNMRLQKFYMMYGGRQFPQHVIDLDFKLDSDPGKRKNFWVQRYTESLLYRGSLDNPVPAETFQQWLDRGYFFHWRVDKNSSDENTRVVIKTEFKVPTSLEQLYLSLFEHHRQIVQIVLTPDKRVLSVMKSDM